jgi:hypothetical protein
MAQECEKVRVGAYKGVPYNSVNWFYWLIVTDIRLIPVRFISGKTLYSYKVVPCPNSDNF